MPILRINTNDQKLHERLQKVARKNNLSLGKLMEVFAQLCLTNDMINSLSKEEIEELLKPSD